MKVGVIISPNDRYNYGDLLFTHVIEHKIGNYYDKLINIATIDYDLLDVGGHKVYSIRDLKKLTSNCNFDIILAGGHSLFCPWPFVLYCLDKRYVWLSKMNNLLLRLLGNKHAKIITNYISKIYFGAHTLYPYSVGKFEFSGIRKLIYNSVDGNLNSSINSNDLKILKSVDYLSLRNKRNSELIEKYDVKTYSSPDSAIQISQIFPPELLSKQISLKEPLSSNYVIFQINRNLGDIHFNDIVYNLKKILDSTSYEIVLCPIGFARGHEDIIPLEKLHNTLNDARVKLFRKLNIWDIMYLISNCICFIGSSLHGCITAMSYSKPYLGLNVTKTIQYINDWGLGSEFCSSCNDFYYSFSRIKDCSTAELKSNFENQLSKSEENFKNIIGLISI